MVDPDIIAWVYPVGEAQKQDTVQYATRTVKKSRWARPPRRQRPTPAQLPRDAREATVPLQDDEDDDRELEFLPYLELRFSDGPRTSAGFVFGKDPDVSDIVIPSIQGISRRHFALTFRNNFEDGRYRLVVRDLGSTTGTTVTYNKQGKHCRRNFDWIISGFNTPDKARNIEVDLREDTVIFRVVVARHDLTSPTYIKNVERFLHGAAASDILFSALRLQSADATELNTAVHTPTNKPILLKQGVLGTGGFGEVSRYWNVSTGAEYACKRPLGHEYSREDWEKEIAIMKNMQHENIVRLCFSMLSPEPRLYLEYMELGNLSLENKRLPFRHQDCWDILRQSLSALVYLHCRREPIAHRDLKPQNILVKSRNPLHIKLADFGLAKAGSLKTYCGTATYRPPEIQMDNRSQRYTVAVDIWSLGVVILQLGYGLPSPGYGSTMAWCASIVKEAGTWESDGLIDILQRMLVLEPNQRAPAKACLSAVESHCEWSQAPGEAAGHVEGNGSGLWRQKSTSYQDYDDSAQSIASVDSEDMLDDGDYIVAEPSGAGRHARSNSPAPELRVFTQAPQHAAHINEAIPRPLDAYAWGLDHARPPSPAALLPGLSQQAPDLNPSRIVTPSAFLPLSAKSIAQEERDPSFKDEAFDQFVVFPPSSSVAGPQVEQPRSHLSTRELLHDRPDFALNASEILSASTVSPTDRHRYLARLKRRGFEADGNSPVWVPFRDGVFVCQAVGLERELEPLLSFPGVARPPVGENYLLLPRDPPRPREPQRPRDQPRAAEQQPLPEGFAVVRYNNDHAIAYKPFEREVNAAHLGRVYNINAHKFSKFFTRNPGMVKSVRRGGLAILRGTYISFEDAEVLCAHFGARFSPVRCLIDPTAGVAPANLVMARADQPNRRVLQRVH
ncbi:58b91467-99f2-4e1f-b778-eb56634c081b [Thermothielavioides terrestris]|uniref:58b91467-99f2-4e1f-b778-eb56634c081b n=1 Tax=Thermothielavioides terrestris TaxID=2587410 RepID=A0A3S5CWD8_9PEZI|nr:58b91467-99f2-4e1f-b778-eb56634c081b [Thermothielavioides terrestris]